LRKLRSKGRRFRVHPLHDSIFPVTSAFAKENSRAKSAKKTKEEFIIVMVMVMVTSNE
jgi:hypothetical protein